MVSEIVKDAVIIAIGLAIVSFLLIVVATFLSIVVYIIKDAFKNDSRISRQAFVTMIEESEKDKGE